MATQRELLDPLGTAIKQGMTRTAPTPPKVAPVPYRSDFEPTKMPAVKKPVAEEITPEDFDEPMVAKLSEVKAKWVPHNDAIEIVRALKDRGTLAPKPEEPKDDGKMASGTELIAGIGVEAPAFVGRTLAGVSRLGSYINPMTYLSETEKARGEAGAQMVEDEGNRQSKAQEEAFKGIGIDTTSKMGEFGKGITKYGIPAAIPIGGGAAASTVKGLAAQGAKYGAAGGAIQSVTDQGAGFTPWQLAKDTAIGAGLWGVTGGAMWIVAPAVVPFAKDVAEKSLKYGTAFEKGGLQGLGMSVSRDYAKVGTPTAQKAATALEKIPAEGWIGKTVFGEKIEIPPPEKAEWFYQGTMQKIGKWADAVFWEKRIGKIIGRAFGTKVRGTNAEKLAKLWDNGQYVNAAEILHWDVRSGQIEGSLGSVYEGALAVQAGLRNSGAKIGKFLEDAGLDTKVNVDSAVSKLDSIINDPRNVTAKSPIIEIAQKYKDLLTEHNTLKDIQLTKQDLFQDLANLKKDNAGRPAYKTFVDAGQDVINAIDDKVEGAWLNRADFINEKKKYRAYKLIEKDITDAAVVSERKSPQGLMEQLADLHSADFIMDPLNAAKWKIYKDIGKAISERNSSDGSFVKAMEYFDKQALGRGRAGGAIPTPGTWPKAPKSPTSAIPDNAGVNADAYAANASEQSANKMAANAYAYVLKSTQEGKATLDFQKLGEITKRLEDGQAGNAGTLGDVLTDPKLREMYKNGLDTPIEIVNEKGVAGSVGEFVTSWPKAGTIVLRSGNIETSTNLADTVLHEGAHSLRFKKGRDMTNDYAPAPATGKGIPAPATTVKPPGSGWKTNKQIKGILPGKTAPKPATPAEAKPKVGKGKNPLQGTIFDQSNKTGAIKIGFGKVGNPESSLIAEARKFRSADEFVNANLNKNSYRWAHQLKLSDSITADKIDIQKLKEQIKIRNWYLNNFNLKDLKNLEKLQNNPEGTVTIYRASPKNELNDWDWVTTDKTYANDIKRQNWGKVYSFTARVKDLRFPKDAQTLPSLSMASSFSYSPKTSELLDIYNKAHNK